MDRGSALMTVVSSTSSKDSMGAGTCVPVASTGMSSYRPKLMPLEPPEKSSASSLWLRARGRVQSSGCCPRPP